ncbi:P-type conjugative transfer ATPase TrbB [Myxococcus llanfairpwllgwyngyllgogerychwyrndrobwllllantysiliogogogochensis]|uniref:P-type conjugative transfer ATPase TrbB n=2 Tax=Myxococcus llanfairpwllgwyngyllgogerychwyrndrobwllllantysiliogogogochensis TaxID=2590453 RepID=A0A540WSQ4_9BACT|nr:P-type conjugative transfer ATPase TrbB [Myxococcus llanfairpwllgwyngyllgogerychwyrndrobwllllantysiliogogogochensis]
MQTLRAILSPLVQYLDDPGVQEISLNPDGALWVERRGEPMRPTGRHLTPDEAMLMVRQVAHCMDREVNAQHQSLPATLPGWGARFHGVIPPAFAAPVFSIRLPGTKLFTLRDFVGTGVLTQHQADELARSVKARLNILVGGGTGSGKTSFSNALLQELAETADRIYVIEDTTELRCDAPNKLACMVNPEYSYQRAVMDAMRMRPDRIVVGEVRDGAALDLLKAWNTGHPGGISTIHANDTRSMLDRLCELIREAVPNLDARELVARTVEICVHLKRDPVAKAGRSITGICRVKGLTPAGAWDLTPLVDE